jgi:Cof subfamily protein (haloacid dehalogenase superfamily)
MQPGPRYDPSAAYVIKSALFDVDNTLVGNESRDVPSERFKRAVASARGSIKVGLATARGLGHTEHILDYIQAEGLSILCNGAQIIDSATHEVVAELTVGSQTGREIVAYARSQQITFWVNSNGEDFFPSPLDTDTYEKLSDTWDRQSARVPAPDFSFEKICIIVLHDITDAQVDSATAFIAQHADNDIALLVGHEKPQTDGTRLYDVFIGHKRANKKDALHYIAKAQGLGLAEIMAVGDGRNDAVLIGTVGLGVAMGNAAQETLDAAAFVTADRRHDGAAIALEYAVQNTRP